MRKEVDGVFGKKYVDDMVSLKAGQEAEEKRHGKTFSYKICVLNVDLLDPTSLGDSWMQADMIYIFVIVATGKLKK